MYFSNEENFYLNDHVNRPDRCRRDHRGRRCRATDPLPRRPLGFGDLTDNAPALSRYAATYGAMEALHAARRR